MSHSFDITWCVLSQKQVHRPEAEAVMRRDDVIESRVNQIEVLYGRMNDVIRLREDAVNDVSYDVN